MKDLKFFSEETYSKSLSFSSPSSQIARKRNEVYNRVMANFFSVRDRMKESGMMFSSMDLQEATMGVTLKEASLQAYLNSFAGYIAIERPLTQMKELLVYKDMITKGTGRVVMPFIGKQEPRTLAEKIQVESITQDNSLTLNMSIVPGSLMITMSNNDGSKVTTVTDNRKGDLLGEGGVLATGSAINYATGELTLKLVDTTYTKARVSYSRDGVADESATRIKPRSNHFLIEAKINKFEYEYNIIQDALEAKTIGSSSAEDVKQAVRDEHQEAINNGLVETLIDNYAGTTLTISLDSFSVAAGMFDSLIRTFKAGLTAVDSAIAAKCYKVIAASAYVVSNSVSDMFCCLDQDQDWVVNNTGFVNGLVGFYKGRAVLRHLAVDEKDGEGYGYAVHKTVDGELAPVALGILLPATDLPLVGNYNNTSEVAGGIYSVEGVSMLTSDLVQKFKLELPSDWNVVSK